MMNITDFEKFGIKLLGDKLRVQGVLEGDEEMENSNFKINKASEKEFLN